MSNFTQDQSEICKVDNGKKLMAAKENLHISENQYASIFANNEAGENGIKRYSKIKITIVNYEEKQRSGKSKFLSFNLDVGQAEYIYKKICEYEGTTKDLSIPAFYKPIYGSDGKMTFTIKRQSTMNGQPKRYPWYVEIKQESEKQFMNLNDYDAWDMFRKIHECIETIRLGSSQEILKKKEQYEEEVKNMYSPYNQ